MKAPPVAAASVGACILALSLACGEATTEPDPNAPTTIRVRTVDPAGNPLPYVPFRMITWHPGERVWLVNEAAFTDSAGVAEIVDSLAPELGRLDSLYVWASVGDCIGQGAEARVTPESTHVEVTLALAVRAPVLAADEYCTNAAMGDFLMYLRFDSLDNPMWGDWQIIYAGPIPTVVGRFLAARIGNILEVHLDSIEFYNPHRWSHEYRILIELSVTGELGLARMEPSVPYLSEAVYPFRFGRQANEHPWP